MNLGADGTARNTTSTALVDCVVAVTGTVGNREFSADARRARLEPDETWEWAVAFGEEADAMPEDPVEAISIDTRASYAARRTSRRELPDRRTAEGGPVNITRDTGNRRELSALPLEYRYRYSPVTA